MSSSSSPSHCCRLRISRRRGDAELARCPAARACVRDYAQPAVAVLTSQADPGSDEFRRRHELMNGLVAELRERTAQVAQGGGEKAAERHRSRGKLPARERVDRLVDPGTAFLELSALAAWEL